MRTGDRSRAARVLVGISALLVMTCATGATPPSADEAKIQALEKQVEDLDQQLARLKSATDPAARQQAMQQHWSLMQDHMRFMRQMPWMGAHGCGDWMMMDPNLMGPGMMGQGGRPGCDWMGHGWMSQGMMGSGVGMGWWGMPSSMTPDVYQRQMQDHMQRMQKQMAAISAEKDPAKQQALIREHYEAMYREMQTMRGMGWMWAPNAAASLPEADSRGAQIVAKYCSQCHAPPPPSLHTKEEWAEVTKRMGGHIGDQVASGSGVLVPSASDLDTLTEYLSKHAKSGH